MEFFLMLEMHQTLNKRTPENVCRSIENPVSISLLFLSFSAYRFWITRFVTMKHKSLKAVLTHPIYVEM
jgi:hypothetical protein